MLILEVFDPPMCCTSGVCGPEPDERLARFSANLDWLKRQGIEVRRHNLAQEPTAFTQRPEVAKILHVTDGSGLPIILVNGNVVSQGDYPSQQKLAELAGLPAQSSSDQQHNRQHTSSSLSVVTPGGSCCSGGSDDEQGCC